MTCHLITFAKNYYHWRVEAASIRLKNQAIKTGLFEKVKIYGENDLKDDSDFWKEHSDFILKNRVGYGYFIWKPYIIGRHLRELKNDDILIYLDAGCEIDNRPPKNEIDIWWQDFCKSIHDDKVYTTPVCVEKDWAKMDLFKRMGVENNFEILHTPQRQSGYIVIKKEDLNIKMVNDWYNISKEDNYHFIDKSPSILPNFPTFNDNRTQAILSLLLKLNKTTKSCPLEAKLIHYSRNRTGISTLL